MNQADVPLTVLARAEAETTRIYKAAGVKLVYANADGGADYSYVLRIVSRALSAKEVNEQALGVAIGTKDVRGSMAYAFYGRIQHFTEMTDAEPGLILGHVMAHELGHLLLPFHSHTVAGLMRAIWDRQQATRAQMGGLLFSPEQSTLIRRTIEAGDHRAN
jgi:hypothetical protein